jgi:galactose mutarotase-like enzyme
MNLVAHNHEIRREQGFDVYVLSNQHVEVAVVPDLGARIISLKNLQTGREWLWYPPGRRFLFRNQPGDDFARSPLFGMDECLPTIAPCSWKGRHLPDHGEAWFAAWSVDAEAWRGGVLRTGVDLAISPFHFERSIELIGKHVRLDYRLVNQGNNEEHFLWAMHPLLQLEPGDQLELPRSTRALLNGASWIDDLDSGTPSGACEKLFAQPLQESGAGIHNPRTADRLDLEWDVAQNNTLGLWLTRGGWNGHHHFALEPANGGSDSLNEAAHRCGKVGALATVTWRVSIRIGI